MKTKILLFTISLFFVYSCNNLDNQSNDYIKITDSFYDAIELGQFNKDLAFEITTTYAECGEWGGHTEEIIIQSDDKGIIHGMFYKYRYNCDSIGYYYSKPFDSLTIQTSKEFEIIPMNLKHIKRYSLLMLNKNFNNHHIGHSGYSHSINSINFKLEYFGYGLISEYEKLKQNLGIEQ